MNSWLASMAGSSSVLPGDTVQLQPNKCYKVSGTIKIQNFMGAHKSITFDGNGSRLRSFNDAGWVPVSQRHVEIQGNDHLTVENLRILGSDTSPGDTAFDSQHAFSILGSNPGSILQNNVADQIYGDYVFIQRNGSPGNYHVPTNITIENNQFGTYFPNVGAGRHQLTIDDANGLTVDGNTFGGNSGLDSIDIEANAISDSVSDVTISSNTWGPGRGSGTTGYWFANAGQPSPVNGVTVAFNTVQRPMNAQILVTAGGSNMPFSNYFFWANTSSVKFDGNGGCSNPTAALMRVQGVNGLTPLQNTQPMVALPQGNCGRLLDATNSSSPVLNGYIDGNQLLNAQDVATIGAGSTACEGNNYIGSDLHVMSPIDAGTTPC